MIAIATPPAERHTEDRVQETKVIRRTHADVPVRMVSPYEAMSLVFEMGYLIAIPAVSLGLGGAWMDRRFGSSPSFTGAGLALAVAISTYAVYCRLKAFISRP